MIVSTAIATQLQIIFSRNPAPKPDGLNLWIDIDLNLTKSTALFHCQEKEVVGTNPNRKVTYRADHDCRLTFTSEAVFNKPYVDLKAHKEKSLDIRNDTSKVEANYVIGPMGVTTVIAPEAEGSVTALTAARSGPHIVVP